MSMFRRIALGATASSQNDENFRRHRTAFNLIELLVVITIIALLIALLLPALQNAKHHVKVLTCLSQLKQIEIGLAKYVAEDKDYRFPPKFSLGGRWSVEVNPSPAERGVPQCAPF